jgi:hypothetical protein
MPGPASQEEIEQPVGVEVADRIELGVGVTAVSIPVAGPLRV